MQDFADDYLLRNSYKPGNLEDQMTKLLELEKAMIDTQDWMNAMRFKLNPDKTEFMMIGYTAC